METIKKHIKDYLVKNGIIIESVELQDDDKFVDLGCDALDIIDLIMALEDKLEIDIPDEKVNPEESLTYSSLAEIAKEIKG